MKRTIMITISLFCIMALLITSCTSVNFAKMNFKTENNSGQILNLRNYGDAEPALLKQAEQIMKSGFLKTDTQEFGYYEIDMSYSHEASYGYQVLWGLMCLVALPLAFVGVPVSIEDCYVTAYLRIFDSTGNLVWKGNESGYYKMATGLYYNPDSKAKRTYKRLFSKLQESATKEVQRINRSLLNSGPITEINTASALERIAMTPLR
jgi:hypothetical protein